MVNLTTIYAILNDILVYCKNHNNPQTTQEWQNMLDDGQELADKYPGRYGIFIGHVIGGYQAMVEKLQEE